MSAGEGIWRGLTDGLHPEGGYVRRRVPVKSGMDVYAALALPGNRPALLIEAAAGSVPAAPTQLNCYGFTMGVAPLTPGTHGRVIMMLELADLRYRDVFVALVDDVLACLAGAADEKAGVRVLLDRLRRWQAFFLERKADGLSEIEQQGLYGELWLMRHSLLPQLTPAVAVASWRGPDGANQDFHLPSCAIEVKTTASDPHETLTVSSVLQLDETGLSDLLVAHIALSPRRNTGETLPALVDDIRNYLGANAPEMVVALDTMLVKAGYLDANIEQYSSTGYSLRHVRFYQVRDGFPRLRECDLPEGVGDVRYSVAVSACARFEIGHDAFRALLI